MTEPKYESLRDTLPGRADAIGLYRLYRLRGQPDAAARYLVLLDERTRRDLTVPDLLLGDRPGADR